MRRLKLFPKIFIYTFSILISPMCRIPKKINAPQRRSKIARHCFLVAPLRCSRTRIMPTPQPNSVANMGRPLVCTNMSARMIVSLSHSELLTMIPESVLWYPGGTSPTLKLHAVIALAIAIPKRAAPRARSGVRIRTDGDGDVMTETRFHYEKTVVKLKHMMPFRHIP